MNDQEKEAMRHTVRSGGIEDTTHKVKYYLKNVLNPLLPESQHMEVEECEWPDKGVMLRLRRISQPKGRGILSEETPEHLYGILIGMRIGPDFLPRHSFMASLKRLFMKPLGS